MDKEKIIGLLKASNRRELSLDEIDKGSGGTKEDADEYLAILMEYHGITNREEMFSIMTEEEKKIYQRLFDLPPEYDKYYDRLV